MIKDEIKVLDKLACWLVENDEGATEYERNFEEFKRLAIAFARNIGAKIVSKQELPEELSVECESRVLELIQKKKFKPNKNNFSSFISSIFYEIQLEVLACWLVENDEGTTEYERNFEVFGRLGLVFVEKLSRTESKQDRIEELNSECMTKMIELIQEKKFEPSKGKITSLIHSIYSQICYKVRNKESIIKLPDKVVKLKKELTKKQVDICQNIVEKRQLLRASKGQILKRLKDEILDLEYQAKGLKKEISKIEFEIENYPPEIKDPKPTQPERRLIDNEYLSVIMPMIKYKNYNIGFDTDGEGGPMHRYGFSPIIIREIALFEKNYFTTIDSLPRDIILYRQVALERMKSLKMKLLSETLKGVSL